MNNSERLFAAILQKDFTAADGMTAAGASLDGDIRDALVKGPSSAANFVLSRYNYYKQFMDFAAHASVDDFVMVVEKLFELVGEPLYNTFGEYRYGIYRDRFFDPKFFEALLKCCSGKQMRKRLTMEEIIDRNSVELLALCAKYGWLKMPRIRDEIIKYSQEKTHTECTAWLLEFKNSNFDLSAERARAEKRAQRELNAAPDSVTELKKIWRTRKSEDGTLEITCYNGRQTEVIVPDKIGKATVASIGDRAFTGDRYAANRTSEEICEFRKNNITKITLPETINSIGKGAFLSCEALKEVNVPSGVTAIEPNTFTNTAIDVIELPETVERLADYAFSAAHLKNIGLPQSIAEIGKGAFQKCDFERIEIPPKIKVINPEMFWNCKCLKEVVLPEGLEEIKPRAFWLCPSLEKINLPASITKIENFKRGGKITSPFADAPKLTATVERGSYAEKYCAKNGVKFKYNDEA